MIHKSLLAALSALILWQSPAQAETARALPPPSPDLSASASSPPTPSSRQETIVLAGGCFWGIQGVFQHVDGVTRAVSGYAGGSAVTAHYRVVSAGGTDHAEAVEVTYDPSRLSLGTILQIFFSVAHDPTQVDGQYPDQGRQYRSAIFPQDEAQARLARGYIGQLNQTGLFPHPIATRIEDKTQFYPAEDYHQDYMTLHPNQPYIAYYDLPKIGELKRLFPDRYRDQPVLISAKP